MRIVKSMPYKAIFLDRDDTLIEDPGYINNPDQVKLLDGVAEALGQLKTMGYKLVVVSNQSAVARGIITVKVLGKIHDRLKQLLAEKGTHLDGIYYCPYHPEGVVEKYRREHDWRKPNAGMLLAAADEMDIDLSESWMVGNSSRDVEAGRRAGCKTILINTSSQNKEFSRVLSNPDFKAVNIKEVANIIKKYHRSTYKSPTETPLTSQGPQNIEKPQQSQTTDADLNSCGSRCEQLLEAILEQLKAARRFERFGDFSMMRMLAGAVQIVVVLCLIISIWFLTSPTRDNDAVLISLGFAAVLQMMSLAFYMMHGQK